jgi:hypothetical protein
MGMLAVISSAQAGDRPTFDSIWQSANAAPGHQTIDGGNAIIIDVPSEKAIYYFSKPGTPVHPGVVKRTIVETPEGISLQTDGWSFGPDNAQPAFKAWLEAFRDQAAEIQQRMHTQSQGQRQP